MVPQQTATDFRQKWQGAVNANAGKPAKLYGVNGKPAGTATYGTDGRLNNTQMYSPQAQAAVTGQQSVPSTDVYSQRQTRAATNQAVANAQGNAQAYDLNKRFRTPGFSRGLGQSRGILPYVMAGRVGAADAQATVPFNDMGANAKFQLAQEVARENESLGWGSLGQSSLDQAQAISNQRQNMGWQLLNQILGV